MEITSPKNQLIVNLTKLHQRKGRLEQQSLLLEGAKNLQDALDSENPIKLILYTQECKLLERNQKVLEQAKEKGIDLQPVTVGVFKKLAQTQTPQGIIGVVKIKPQQIESFSFKGRILVLDRIQDPGNLGTILRSAAAFGFNDIILLSGTADPYNEKTVRAAAGAIFYLNLYMDVTPEYFLRRRKELGITLVVSAVRGGFSLKNQDILREPLALVIGNEGQGVDPLLNAAADCLLSIEMEGLAESLNAGVAAGILMYQIQNQIQNITCQQD